MQAGNYELADICRMNYDESEQAGQHKGGD
jgi:hypothetical protein